MGRARRKRGTTTILIDRLEFKGVSGCNDLGARWMAKGASVGDTVLVQTGRKGKASVLEILETSEQNIDAECPHFLTCGGCQLQNMPIEGQRQQKEAMIRRLFSDFAQTTTESSETPETIHPIVGANAYHYRNKMELSFGTRRFFANPEEAKEAETGSFLGLHPWKWYSKIVPLTHCSLAHPSIEKAIQLLQSMELSPAWNTHSHTGVWRHVVLRYGGGLLVNLVTSSEATLESVQTVAHRLQSLPDLRGVLWTINDGVAEVATGELQAILFGTSSLEVTLCGKQLEIPYDGFAQVNDAGAELLMDVIRTAAGRSTRLLDLYCGSGAIGIALADHFEEVIGIEIQPEAIERAKSNAKRNHVTGKWIAGKVEDCLTEVQAGEGSIILLDPPREGLHPKAAKFFSEQHADCLVYVACNPRSLERDRTILEAGNWKMTDLWMVDMFPQTPHVECVGRFIYTGKGMTQPNSVES